MQTAKYYKCVVTYDDFLNAGGDNYSRAEWETEYDGDEVVYGLCIGSIGVDEETGAEIEALPDLNDPRVHEIDATELLELNLKMKLADTTGTYDDENWLPDDLREEYSEMLEALDDD